MLRLYQLRYDNPHYPARAETCKDLIWDTARQVLRAGVDVVLDWNQWSRAAATSEFEGHQIGIRPGPALHPGCHESPGSKHSHGR